MDNNYSPGADKENLAAIYGVGVLADIGGNRAEGTNLQLRGDLGARRGLGSTEPLKSYTDYVAGLGLQYSWGGTPPAKPVGDSDGDGVNDDLDKCPGTPAGTPVNADGCPLDSDGDGVTDDKDKCPNTPAGATVDATGCELDTDGDGVADSKDKCPNTPQVPRLTRTAVSWTLTATAWSTARTSAPIHQRAIVSMRRVAPSRKS
ncbi:MAG: thrombospondin type 3 repeat-containing protein [Proteobacteria bacterium]|nr:thrombospondin type 3 repeat-containing protein [Pseudomonadota bacterium]